MRRRHVPIWMLSLLLPVSALHAAGPVVTSASAAASSLQVIKADQRRLGIRTQRADTPVAGVLLPAEVIADPRAGARVMADQRGVLEAPAGGFAQAGEAVRAGQLLARLRPLMPEPERRDLESELAAARRDVALGKLQVERYSIDEAKAFEGHLVTPSVRIIIEYQGALARQAQLERALSAQVDIRAPVAGRLQSSVARAGAVVDAGQTLFEVSAPQGLAVQVLLGDADLDASRAITALSAAGPVSLRYLGEAVLPSVRASHAVFAVEQSQAPLSVGEPLRVLLPRRPVAGWRVPADGVFAKAGRHWVWLHEGAETFVARAVQAQALDRDWVRVEGLKADDRIVVAGRQALDARAGAAL